MIQRYVRALLVALRMTLRGERPQAKYPALREWMEAVVKLTDEVFEVSAKHGMRGKFIVKIDGRPMSMETILKAVRYHVTEEYPYLLRDETTHSLTAIYSSNLNDQYHVQRLGEALEQTEVKMVVVDLAQFLAQIPADVNPQT